MRGAQQHTRSQLRARATLWLVLLAFMVCVGLTACGTSENGREPETVRLAASYTVEQSGLFAELSPLFSERTGFRLVGAFVGSGRALDRARKQQADVVWVHSRPLEDAFVAQGHGINRTEVMASEYVLVGPKDDPAKIAGSASSVEALTRIHESGATFVSRGDGSGTHTRELALWRLANIDPKTGAYLSLAKGMIAVLHEASQVGGYALSDYPTFLTHRENLNSRALVKGDSRLLNPYSVIAVNPTGSEDINYAGAMALIDFATSEDTQRLIATFGKRKVGVALFRPLARPEVAE